MSISKTLLATIAAVFTFAAIPALASADPSHVDFSGSTKFGVEGGSVSLSSVSFEVHCTSLTGHGSFENGTTGNISFTFHGCKTPTFFNVSCKSFGTGSGTIITTNLPFHMEKVNGDPAMLITSTAGHFGSFTCSFLANIVVSGNGIIGTVTNPGYNEASETATIDFNPSAGGQEDSKVDGSETYFGSEASTNGGSSEFASLNMESTIYFKEGGSGTLTE